MDADQIIEKFEWFDRKFELEAVEAALANREEVTPELLAILEELAEDGAAVDDSGDYMAHLYAMYLLAQFRETRAYPRVVRIALLPSEDLEEMLGDFVTVSLGSVLASVCGGDLTGIKSIIECETADEWARGAAINSLVILANTGLLGRDEVIEYFGSLYRGKLARTPENEEVWSQLVMSTEDLYPEELLNEIEQAYADDLIDSRCIALDDIRDTIAKGRDQALARLARDPHHQLVNDTVKEFGSWACFHESPEDSDSESIDDGDPEDTFDASDVLTEPGPWNRSAPLTYSRPAPKVGRNEPCPCGSGKKYKKCCGA